MFSPDDGQLSTMNGMLANGSHPRAIANKDPRRQDLTISDDKEHDDG
jgi:hypothetical protein